jgi:phosphatidylethanolamine-binding protein (PEBP) family uncharacterized protein
VRIRNPILRRSAVFAWGLLGAVSAGAHVIGDREHDETAARFAREFPESQLAFAEGGGGGGMPPPALFAMFERFAPAVRVRSSEKFIFVESNGLPAHGMMVGITAWQQQVPLPQAYVGGNAWQIPLHPAPSPNPVSIRVGSCAGRSRSRRMASRFSTRKTTAAKSPLRSASSTSGGHCGRADDYHYHVAPLHLQAVLGPQLPVAVALDGYPIYGLAEPDGSEPKQLDACNGHETSSLGYHYHASTKYPYVNGGFHGLVVEREEQVDPQPRAQGVRPAQPPLRGARIVGFKSSADGRQFDLQYTVGGWTGAVGYRAVADGAWEFSFTGAGGAAREETFRAADRRAGAGRGGPRRGDDGPQPPPREREEPRPPAEPPPGSADEAAPRRTGAMTLRSPAVGQDGVLPVEFTGDGASISPPLEWSGAPEATRSFAVIMHHLAPDGETKWYWTLYNLPADVHRLPKNSQGIGTLGNNSVNRRAGYAPPHSKGPGLKTYVLTIYALSAPVKISAAPPSVNRAVLLAAMQNLILDSAELKVNYTRSGGDDPGPPERSRERGRSHHDSTPEDEAVSRGISGCTRRRGHRRGSAAEFCGHHGRGPGLVEHLGCDGRSQPRIAEPDFCDPGDRASRARGHALRVWLRGVAPLHAVARGAAHRKEPGAAAHDLCRGRPRRRAGADRADPAGAAARIARHRSDNRLAAQGCGVRHRPFRQMARRASAARAPRL